MDAGPLHQSGLRTSTFPLRLYPQGPDNHLAPKREPRTEHERAVGSASALR